MRRSHIGMGMLGVFLLALAGTACENATTEVPPDTYDPRWRGAEQTGSIFGSGGVTLFGGEDEAPASGIGVNAFLWRATLDTISFMPLLSADPFGGVIITDWYSPSESPDERFKMTVYILGSDVALGRCTGLRVSPGTRRGRSLGGPRHEPGDRGQPRRQDPRPRPSTAYRTTRRIESTTPDDRRCGAAAPAHPSCYRDAALRHRPGGGSERCR